MKSNVMTFQSPRVARPVADLTHTHPLKKAFADLLRTPQAVSPNSPGGQGPAFGPYNMPIYYLSDGMVVHTAGQYINKLRGQRAHTVNALELRCDALGLVVYVSGVIHLTDLNPNGKMKCAGAIRVVAYDYDKLKPTCTLAASSPEELEMVLRDVLVKTYNKLALEFNLAGLANDVLMLKSTSEQFPNIKFDR